MLALRFLQATNVSLFRLSKGRVGGTFAGAPVILLTTSRHKTGTRETRPLLALPDDAAWIVVGPRRGVRYDHDWYEDLVAYELSQQGSAARPSNAPVLIAPEVEYRGDRRVAVRSEVLSGAQRASWWARMVEVYPRFDAHPTRSPHREIPMLRLTPSGR
jgi:F420H(2)-dependent quinone reductase